MSEQGMGRAKNRLARRNDKDRQGGTVSSCFLRTAKKKDEPSLDGGRGGFGTRGSRTGLVAEDGEE